ncbi:50S ribosomal protein L18 [Candidatus Nomurabacteria bacterium RIFCSPLOWO2_01_FULL_42_20]|uniref:Large ribosomal subunit protein uL18 n=1 Tax=Candidatus Nomurabacteria bacterium RIFCSPHIGHO2_01_FULL_42_16 TaxID=1801743 RepID=A0A1F6VMF1_9BACT|nr:MAG: 50S ribosomal protein L18 [Candidatus Nomurabacteria bacterium RIFCSPHIGHO2_01_FULL_42_16]OGI91303.1 MAG: 50S ribosomal protein L18 [Candidatus Nomurabacteria bacterium RIFCSPLOWO2_01_FULL_42_20]
MNKQEKRNRLKKKIRAKIFGTSEKPRLSVFRSNKFIYAELIDDQNGVTLASASDIKIKKGTKKERAQEVGKKIALDASAKKISKAVFDRGGFKYMGRIQILAEQARKSGLKF